MKDVLAGTLAKRQHARVTLDPQCRYRFTEAGLYREIQPHGAIRITLHVSEYFSIRSEASGPHSYAGGRPLPPPLCAHYRLNTITLQGDGRIEGG